MKTTKQLLISAVALIVLTSAASHSEAQTQTTRPMPATNAIASPALSQGHTHTNTQTIKRSPFTISIPAGWSELPQKDLDEIHQTQQSAARAAGRSVPAPACGFRLNLTNEYPRILVMVIDSGRVPEETVGKMDSQEWNSGIKKGASTAEHYASALSNVRAGQSVYDRERKVIWVPISAQVEGHGVVKQLSAMRLTKTGFVVFGYAAQESDFEKHLPSFLSLVRGLEIDKSFEY